MLELCLQFVGDDDRNDLLDDVNHVMRDNIVLQPLSLLDQVNGSVIAWKFLWGEELTSAGSAGILESVVLEDDKPNEGHQVRDNDVWSHQVKHLLAPLEVIHQR